MTITVTIRRQSADTPSHDGIFTVKDYNTLKPLQGSADIDNFQAIKIASFVGTDPNSVPFFDDTAKYQVVDYNYLKTLQFDEPAEYGSINQKMNWLVNHGYDDPTSPKYKDYDRPYWLTANGQLRFGTILFGQTRVRVEVVNGAPKEYRRWGRYPGKPVGSNEEIVFYRVLGALDWIVDATAIEGGQPTNRPRGVTIRHPVWPAHQYPVNYGDGQLYIARAFLESS